MPSKTPIFPLRLDPQLRERADAFVTKNGLTLNAWIGQLVRSALDGGSATAVTPKTIATKALAEPQRKKRPLNRAERRQRARRLRMVDRDIAKEAKRSKPTE